MIEFIAIDKTGRCKPLKVTQLSWEIDPRIKPKKLRLYFHGALEYSEDSKGEVISGFCGDDEESTWMLCQVIKP
jgi:hypothetical protein